MAPDARPKVRTIENTADLLEHKLVTTLIEILDTGTERNKLTAIDKTADILGKKSKQQVIVTEQVNVQNNNFLEHFKKQALPQGEPDANTGDMPASISPNPVDARDADFTYEGDGD